MKGTLRTAAVVLLALAAGAVAADDGTVTIGRLLTADAMDTPGEYVRTLESPALVQTLSDSMTVELDRGKRIGFDANTSARLERLASGVIRIRVLSGTVWIKDARGEVRTAGARSVFHLDDEVPVISDDVVAPGRAETDDRPRRTEPRPAGRR